MGRPRKYQAGGFKNVYCHGSMNRRCVGAKVPFYGAITIDTKKYKTGYRDTPKLAARALDLMMIKNCKPQINNTFKQV